MCAFLALGILPGPPIALASDSTKPAIAVLLDEKGEPRCKISGGHHDDFPINGLDAFDTLEECTELFSDPKEIHMAGVPSPGKISGPALLAAGKIWAKAHGPAVAILSFAEFCALKKKHPARPIFYLGYIGSIFFHIVKLRTHLQVELGMTLLSLLGTPFVSRQAAYLACDGE